uniref:Protein kinase domain-containing protein n=1 Tax=viral metagenome TaxID=1070528 RepID=A0A6C0HAH1_9ZZZZ
MPLQHGGLALKNTVTGDTYEEKYENAFMYMIENASEIKCISYDSLSGYIFIIYIAEEKAVFLNLDDKNEFTIPVTNILVKFALITPEKIRYPSIIVKRKEKHTMTISDFEEEKKIQLDIYNKTLESNNIPICPSIIFYKIIKRTTDSAILHLFYNKIEEKNDFTEMNITKRVIEEIIKYAQQKSNFDVGIIGMEYANGYITFNDYLDKIKENPKHLPRIYNSSECGIHCNCIANIIINIIRLFISTGVIHMDLHVNNIMINMDKQKSLLIDFGFYKKMIDIGPCKEEIDVTPNSIIFKKEIKKGKYGSTNTNIMSTNAIVKFVKLKLGESYDNIRDEQLFMQTYLFNINDETRMKHIIKLFLLIVMCDLNLNSIRLERSIIMMRDFLVFLGLQIKTIQGGVDIMSSKNINDIDDNAKSLDNWISENINYDKTKFFKKVFTAVLEKIKKMYWINDDSIYRIGYTPEIHKALKETSSAFSFGKGGSQTKYKRKRISKIKKHNKTKKNV